MGWHRLARWRFTRLRRLPQAIRGPAPGWRSSGARAAYVMSEHSTSPVPQGPPTFAWIRSASQRRGVAHISGFTRIRQCLPST
jgi:hypothetical protein